MSVGLDTSVVLRLLVGEPVEQTAAAWLFVSEQAASPAGSAAVSDLVVSESYFALRHHYGVPHAVALQALGALLADRRVHCTGVAALVVVEARAARSGAGFVDRLIHAVYATEGTTLVTFDRAAGALANARILDEDKAQ